MNLEYRINESYDRLTANDREVLNQILWNRAQSAGVNSTGLVTLCHVSGTTLIRLFKKPGIDGFAELGLLLREQAEMQELARLDMGEIISNYHRMVDDLREYDYSMILEAIHEAGTICLYGTGDEQKAIGEEFKHVSPMFGECYINLFDCEEMEYASRCFKSRDLFVAISLSGESENDVQVLRLVQCREIKALSITRWTNSTVARICRYNLYAETRMISGSGEPGYEMVAAFHILLDMLSINYLEYERKGHEAGGNVQ